MQKLFWSFFLSSRERFDLRDDAVPVQVLFRTPYGVKIFHQKA